MGQTRELIEKVRQAFVTGDFSAFPALILPDAEISNPFTTVHGPDAFAELGRAFCAACSDRRLEVLVVVEDRDAAAAEIHVTARHTGALQLPEGEAPPTGNQISYEEAAIVRVRDGRIASWHSYYDMLVLAQQLGIAQPAAPVDGEGAAPAPGERGGLPV
jgi:ketosteroid isomerase-like protein